MATNIVAITLTGSLVSASRPKQNGSRVSWTMSKIEGRLLLKYQHLVSAWAGFSMCSIVCGHLVNSASVLITLECWKSYLIALKIAFFQGYVCGLGVSTNLITNIRLCSVLQWTSYSRKCASKSYRWCCLSRYLIAATQTTPSPVVYKDFATGVQQRDRFSPFACRPPLVESLNTSRGHEYPVGNSCFWECWDANKQLSWLVAPTHLESCYPTRVADSHAKRYAMVIALSRSLETLRWNNTSSLNTEALCPGLYCS